MSIAHAVRALIVEPDVVRDALLDIARRIEALKKPCGVDPESPQALRNGEYMSIALAVRSLAALQSHGTNEQPRESQQSAQGKKK